MPDQYEFSVDWFTQHWPNWLTVTAERQISKILEVGSFEGRSACTMIEHFGKKSPIKIFCVDDWGGSFELDGSDMEAVERRFDRNINRAISVADQRATIYKYKGRSIQILSSLLSGGHRASFDLIFIDGSHEAPDVLGDLVLAYHLCAKNGLIICDDYLWSGMPHGHEDLLTMPRESIDAFTRIFCRKVQQLSGLPLYQIYLRKTG